jgi:hypothetical protein
MQYDEKECPMYASVVHVKPESFESTKGFVRNMGEKDEGPRIESIPGFKAYYAFEDDGWITSVAIFEDEAGKDAWWEMCKSAYKDVWQDHVKPVPGTVKWSSGHVTHHRSS